MKQQLLVSLLLVSAFAVNAQIFTANDLVYSVNENGTSVTVTGHVDGTEATGSIAIPNIVSFNGHDYPVTVIGERAFAWTHSLHGTLTIGNNVTDIGDAAFQRCDSLSGNLNIPSSVVNIGNAAFSDCDGFTGSLTIPNSVVTIGVCAFDQCDGFNDTLIIGSSVASIGNGAFMLCINITKAISLATTPPMLGELNGYSHVFDNMGCSSVIVPCDSKEAYENSLWQGNYNFTTIIEDCESIQENDNDAIIGYPNPAQDYVRIELSDNSACQSIEIYSLDGRLVETFPETSLQTTIDISGLNAGMYIMKIRMAEGKEYTERIIKE